MNLRVGDKVIYEGKLMEVVRNFDSGFYQGEQVGPNGNYAGKYGFYGEDVWLYTRKCIDCYRVDVMPEEGRCIDCLREKVTA